MGTGLIVGVVMTFMGIYLALKIGLVFLVGAEMLGAIFLGMKGRYTREENAIAVTIANSSSIVAIGVLLTYPAIAIFDTNNPIFNASHVAYDPSVTLFFIMFTTGISAVFGIVLLAPFRDRFEHEPWPRVQPQAECINSIGSDAESRKAVGVGLAASGAWVGNIEYNTICFGTCGSSGYSDSRLDRYKQLTNDCRHRVFRWLEESACYGVGKHSFNFYLDSSRGSGWDYPLYHAPKAT
jgi:uncharacterized oligopeptide transporter (OPT) family protein